MLNRAAGAPYYCFHDRDVAPEGATPRVSVNNLHAMVYVLGEKQQQTGMKLLWGTANLFSHRRFMSGAAAKATRPCLTPAWARSWTRWAAA